MELIIGGAFQGKTDYAKKEYPSLIWKEAGDMCEEELLSAEGILNFQEYIKKEIREGRNPGNVGELLLKKNSGAVVVSEEVGYGLVPVDAFEREYREAVGRICTKLASGSHKVTRVICGIGMVIKND